MKLHQYPIALESLCAYRGLRQTPVLQAISTFFECLAELEREQNSQKVGSVIDKYCQIFYLLRQEGYRGLGDYFWDCFRYQENHYGSLVLKQESDPALEYSARREVEILSDLAKLDCDVWIEAIRPFMQLEDQFILSDLPRWSTSSPFEFGELTEFYQQNGCGIFAKYTQFLWRKQGLSPILRGETRTYSGMVGYDLQRSQVYENTQKLVNGQPALNVLLFGDGGTGKSAVVKSMAFVPEFNKLRIIQVENDNLRTLPDLMAQLQGQPYPFIIFIDDLAFDQDDNTYSALKSSLEGGLEVPPSNVVVYATSNRRHLVRQTFQDRAGDEVDMKETISEKTALSERFGLRIPYLSMSKEEYLRLVAYLYQEAKMQGDMPTLSSQDLNVKAMMWEIRHGGRTPRVAGQFVASLSGEQ